MTGMVLLMVLLVVFAGVTLAATPWIMPPTECFAVTVPPSAQRDPRVRGYKFAYAGAVMASAVACAVVLYLVLRQSTGAVELTGVQLDHMTVAILALTFVPMVVGLVLMLYFRARVRQLKQNEGWLSTASRATAVVGGNVPRPISLAWNLLYVPIVAGMVLFAVGAYDRFPDVIPMQADFAGNVTHTVPKSLGAVTYPALITGFLGLVFTATHAMTLVSKRPVDPAAPATSALAYGRFVRIQTLTMLVGGLVISIVTGVSFFMSALGKISLLTAGLMVGLVAIAWAMALLGVSVVTGQSGSRLAAELRPNDALLRDDDAFWKLGMFYWNPKDPSIIIPKRFGVGWTINYARPEAWAISGGLVVLTVVFVMLTNSFAG